MHNRKGNMPLQSDASDASLLRGCVIKQYSFVRKDTVMSNIMNLLSILGAVFFVVLVLMFIFMRSAKSVMNTNQEDHGSGEKYSKNAPSS